MKCVIVEANTDLGVHIDGANLGPSKLSKSINNKYYDEIKVFNKDQNIIKSKDKNDKAKNIIKINEFNKKLFNGIETKIKDGLFPLMIGGDHSCSIASSLASAKHNDSLGIIWIDAHSDYHTFTSTVTGNIHGLPLAAISGYNCNKLREFYDGNTIDPSKVVIVGARSIDDGEIENLKNAKVTIFTTNDIIEKGVSNILKEAFDIASNHYKNCIHISYDLDVINPDVAPGVSIPEKNGITETHAMQICDYIVSNFNFVASFDLVEFNPLKDKNQQTEKIAINILNKILNAINQKK